MVDPLAVALGAIDPGEPIRYTFSDCVKVAGHACASVSSAFAMTRLALAALYGDQTPVRGEIAVRIAGGRDEGAIGPIGQVIQFLTGAAIESGFKGLGGRFVRAGLFTYDETMKEEGAATIVARFTRLDTGVTVTVTADPSLLPLSDDDRVGGGRMGKAITGKATEEERRAFFDYWQGKNEKILLGDYPGLFTVTREDAPNS